MIEFIIFGCILLCILVALLMYWSTAPFLIKLLTLPFTISFSLFIVWQMISLMGSPLKRFPIGEFTYIHHEPLNGGKAIALWVWSERFEDFRLYLFPYDRDTAKKLQKARQKKQEGKPTRGKFKSNKETKNGQELVISPGTPRPSQPTKDATPEPNPQFTP